MRPTSRISAWAATLAMAAVAGLVTVAGCALNRPESQPGRLFEQIGRNGGGGQVIQPRQCLIRVAILERPFRDPAVNEAAWRVADEQILSPEARKALASNGLRVGRILGELPKELESLLRGRGPGQDPVEPANLLVESGQPSPISLTPRMPEVSLLLDRGDRVNGRDYIDASGFLRLTPSHSGARGVSLRITPEIHHGPVQRTFPTLPNPSGLAPQQFSIRDAQKEEILTDLAFDLTLEDGQVAILGTHPESIQSLGTFLFSPRVADNQERRQRIVLIWASRNMSGVIAGTPKAERPRRPKPAMTEPTANPAPPDPTPPPIPATPPPTSGDK